MKIIKLTGCSLALTFLLLSVTGWGADWPTFGHDPQRSGWATQEDSLNVNNVSGLKLLWKAQIKNEPRSLAALTAPVVADAVTTPKGIRSMVYVAGSSDNINAIDAHTGELVWSRTFESHVLPKDAGHVALPEQSERDAHH